MFRQRLGRGGRGVKSLFLILLLIENCPVNNKDLTPQRYTRTESGTSVRGRRKISKGGNSTVRKILCFPTLNCIQHNTNIRTFYERLVNNHKPKKLAVIAAMRKLLLIAHAVYRDRESYRDAA